MKRKNIKRLVPKQKRIELASIGIGLAILLIALWPSLVGVRLAHEGELKVWFFDVGQGDATFIETPDGKQLLIDGGPDDRVLQKLSSVMLPWDRYIDAILITHPDADHITGLISVLENYKVGTIYETGVRGFTPTIDQLVEAMTNEGANIITLRKGDTIPFGEVSANVLWPTQEVVETSKQRNNTSIVLQMTFGDSSFLFTGDAEQDAELSMLKSVQDIDILKIGHHGSKTSSTVAFLKRSAPEYAIISAGEENRFGHPHAIVVSRLKDMYSDYFITGIDGDVLVTSKGGEPIVAVFPLPY